jgi:hypothetical protein
MGSLEDVQREYTKTQDEWGKIAPLGRYPGLAALWQEAAACQNIGDGGSPSGPEWTTPLNGYEIPALCRGPHMGVMGKPPEMFQKRGNG